MYPEIHYCTEPISSISSNKFKSNKFNYVFNPCNGKWGNEQDYISKSSNLPKLVFNTQMEKYPSEVQYVYINSTTAIVNAIVYQIKEDTLINPTFNTGAFRVSLNEINAKAKIENATIHMLRKNGTIGNMEWDEIVKILRQVMSVDIYIYDR